MAVSGYALEISAGRACEKLFAIDERIALVFGMFFEKRADGSQGLVALMPDMRSLNRRLLLRQVAKDRIGRDEILPDGDQGSKSLQLRGYMRPRVIGIEDGHD